jgi:hypothetical protein
MAATLTFHPRRSLLEATLGGKALVLPTYPDPARVHTWEHRYEMRSGKYTLWDHASRVGDAGGNLVFTAAAAPSALEVYDYPGAYAQRFDEKNTTKLHSHAGHALFIGSRTRGIYIHGSPACNLDTCVIVLQQWETLRRAIADEQRLSFSILL